MSIREFMELQAVKISAKRLIQASIRDKVVKLHSAIGGNIKLRNSISECVSDFCRTNGAEHSTSLPLARCSQLQPALRASSSLVRSAYHPRSGIGGRANRPFCWTLLQPSCRSLPKYSLSKQMKPGPIGCRNRFAMKSGTIHCSIVANIPPLSTANSIWSSSMVQEVNGGTRARLACHSFVPISRMTFWWYLTTRSDAANATHTSSSQMNAKS